jgi:ribonuclease HI
MALRGPNMTSELVVECLNALSVLASLNEVTLTWVPGHCGILGNEEADKLARQVSAMSLTGPKSALGKRGNQDLDHEPTSLCLERFARPQTW